MPMPLQQLVNRIKPGSRARRVWAVFSREVAGLAQDYWKDGHWERPEELPQDEPAASASPRRAPGQSVFTYPVDPEIVEGKWHALAGEVSERMWGPGNMTPGGDALTDMMLEPFHLTEASHVLDLSAGLGARAHRIAHEFGAKVSGFEPDPDVAHRGSVIARRAFGEQVTIDAYDPLGFTPPGAYHCIILREVFFRVPEKEKFIASVVGCCADKAQISFTDYVVNSEDRSKPGIEGWRAFEMGAAPVSLVEMAELWAKAGISIRVHDDQTDNYRKEIKRGLMRLVQFMSATPKPDAATKKEIAYRITLWAHRIAALEQGMRLYRFYGVKG